MQHANQSFIYKKYFLFDEPGKCDQRRSVCPGTGLPGAAASIQPRFCHFREWPQRPPPPRLFRQPPACSWSHLERVPPLWSYDVDISVYAENRFRSNQINNPLFLSYILNLIIEHIFYILNNRRWLNFFTYNRCSLFYSIVFYIIYMHVEYNWEKFWKNLKENLIYLLHYNLNFIFPLQFCDEIGTILL